MVLRTLNKRVSKIMTAYYRGPDHPLKLRLWRWVRRATGYPRLTIPYAKGGWITVDERDLLQGKIFSTGSYEAEVWDTLSAFAVSGEVVWDIGAHIGSFSIRALGDPRIREVHAFEPDPIHSEILALNLALNGGCYTIHQFALGDCCERRKLHHGPGANTGLSSFASDWKQQVFEVECKTADEMVFVERVSAPTLIKMDIEGWEYPAFQGFRRLLSEASPKAIVFEGESDSCGNCRDQRLVSLLEKFQYRISKIERPSGILETRENYLATHDPSPPLHLSDPRRP